MSIKLQLFKTSLVFVFFLVSASTASALDKDGAKVLCDALEQSRQSACRAQIDACSDDACLQRVIQSIGTTVSTAPQYEVQQPCKKPSGRSTTNYFYKILRIFTGRDEASTKCNDSYFFGNYEDVHVLNKDKKKIGQCKLNTGRSAISGTPKTDEIDEKILLINCDVLAGSNGFKKLPQTTDEINKEIRSTCSGTAPSNLPEPQKSRCQALLDRRENGPVGYICVDKANRTSDCELFKQACGTLYPELKSMRCTQSPVIGAPGSECTSSGGTVKTDVTNNKQFCDCSGTGKQLVETADNIGRCGQPSSGDTMTKQQCDAKNDHKWVPGVPNQCVKCATGLKIIDSSGTESCGCYSDRGYHPVAGGCQYQPAPVGGSCRALEGSALQGDRCVCPADQRPNDQQNKCIPKEDFTIRPPVPEPRPASCRGQQGTAGDGQIRVGGQCSDCIGNSVPNAAKDACVAGTPGRECQKDGVVGRFNDAGECVKNVACFSSSSCGEGRRCENGQCQSICQNGQVFQSGRCVNQQQECPQGQIRQNGQCVPQQQQCKQDEEMIQGRCFPKKPNAQQPKEQPKQQPGPTPQQQQQQQMLQAMQECQMRQPPGAWQWNGFQCLPNPNYKPQNYGAQPSVTGGVVCNFFGSDAIEVPAGEQFSVTYDVSGAKREIKVDTSPKSTTQYQRQAPTTQPTNTGVLNQFGYGQDGSVPGTTVQTSQQGQATITAPKKKGKLKVSLIIDAVRQNSEACKPITVTVTDAVQQSSYDNSNGSSNYDSGSQYPTSNVSEDTGPTIETPSEIIAQNRKTISSQPAQKAPEDDDAYAYLCKTLGIGCIKDIPDTSSTPSIRDLQLRNEPAQGSTREITIDPNAEDPADLPNIGDMPGESGNGQGQQQLATDIGVDGDNKKAYSTVLNYLGENGQYAEPIGPNSDNSGVLNSTDAEPPVQAGDRVGIFTRLWRWFLNLLGFGPEYVAA